MDHALILAELLATRLCHDISGPLNTVWGALEEAGDPAAGSAESLALAQEAAEALVRRLQLLRAAWGGPGEMLTPEGLAQLAAGVPGPGIALDCTGLAPETIFAPELGQLLLNLLILAGEAMPRGGRVAIAEAGADVLVLIADGPRAAWPQGLAAAIADLDALGEVAPHQVQSVLCVLIARRAGFALSFLMAAGTQAVPPLLIRRIG